MKSLTVWKNRYFLPQAWILLASSVTSQPTTATTSLTSTLPLSMPDPSIFRVHSNTIPSGSSSFPPSMPLPPRTVEMPDPSILRKIDTLGLFSTPSTTTMKSEPIKTIAPQQAKIVAPFARDAKKYSLIGHPKPPAGPPPLPPPQKRVIVKPKPKTFVPAQKYDYLPSYSSSWSSSSKNVKNVKNGLQSIHSDSNFAAEDLANYFSELKQHDAKHKEIESKYFNEDNRIDTNENDHQTNKINSLSYDSIARHFTVEPLQHHSPVKREIDHQRPFAHTAQNKFLPLPSKPLYNINLMTNKNKSEFKKNKRLRSNIDASTSSTPSSPPNPFVKKWTDFAQTVIFHRMNNYLSNAASHDIYRHFLNLIRLFIAGGVPPTINIQNLQKNGFGKLLTFKSSVVSWKELNEHSNHEIMCRFGIQGQQCANDTVDALGWEIDMPSIKSTAIMSDRLMNTMLCSTEVPLSQALGYSWGKSERSVTTQSGQLKHVQRMIALKHQLNSAGANSKLTQDSGFREDDLSTKTSFFKGIHRQSLELVAKELLRLPKVPTSEAIGEVQRITSKMVVVAKFLKSSKTNDQVVGLHVLIDQRTVYRRGLVITGQKKVVCHSIPIFNGMFGIDLCIGPPTESKEKNGKIQFSFDASISFRLVVGEQLLETPFLSMPSALIPIHPFMTRFVGR
jgi:hypothetical protein